MNVARAEIADVLVLEPKVFSDARGHFLESYNRRKFREAAGIEPDFVQDNQSFSVRNVLRGLHYQIHQPQGKLVQVLLGEIYDVVVDLRRRSPTFGRWAAVNLSAATHRMVWVPAGFAHGFFVTSEHALVQYKVTEYYAPEHERTILWSDRDLAIKWPLEHDPVLNEKDARGGPFKSAQFFD
jgi:dTDP-4-dehydrorhamnose 3,5-epimerase